MDRFLPMDSGRGFLSSERTKRNFGTFDLRLASAHACSAPYRSGRSGRTLSKPVEKTIRLLWMRQPL